MKTSVPERSRHVAPLLDQITRVIRELMKDDLAMVILFGSYARGTWVSDRYVEEGIVYTYESDFDLLVVTENRGQATVDGERQLTGAIKRRLERMGLDRLKATILVEHIDFLNKELRRGQYFFADLTKEGVLLYDSGRHTLAEPGAIDPAQQQQYAREDFEYWYTSACGFLKMYEAALAIDDNNIAAFQLHQATERFLNAIVLTFTRYKPKTHDIEALDRQACNLHPEFFTVFPRATEEQKHRFELLKAAYIDARYKQSYVITREELEYLATRVQKLKELAKRLCEERIAGMVSQ